jgi:hypothetical protein
VSLASRIPGHWVDTLQHEARVALSDRALGKPADVGPVAEAARALGLVLLSPDTTVWPQWTGRLPPPGLWLSRPGFNGDSTIAAVRIDTYCGIQCGHGQTMLLARRPGMRWQVWYTFMHWVA